MLMCILMLVLFINVIISVCVIDSQVSTSAYETMYENDFLSSTQMPWSSPDYKAADPLAVPLVISDTDDARSESTDVRRTSMASSMKESALDVPLDGGQYRGDSDDNTRMGRKSRRTSEDTIETGDLGNTAYLEQYTKSTTPAGNYGNAGTPDDNLF